jgi:uncharacterized membrane protein
MQKKAKKHKSSEAEIVRRLKEVVADEEKYFPGVLGNPVIYAARWGLSLSKSYRAFKSNALKRFTLSQRTKRKIKGS